MCVCVCVCVCGIPYTIHKYERSLQTLGQNTFWKGLLTEHNALVNALGFSLGLSWRFSLGCPKWWLPIVNALGFRLGLSWRFSLEYWRLGVFFLWWDWLQALRAASHFGDKGAKLKLQLSHKLNPNTQALRAASRIWALKRGKVATLFFPSQLKLPLYSDFV